MTRLFAAPAPGFIDNYCVGRQIDGEKINSKKISVASDRLLMVTSVIPQAAYAAIADTAGTDRAPGRAVVNGGVDGTAIEIEGVNSVIVSGAAEQENGDYV